MSFSSPPPQNGSRTLYNYFPVVKTAASPFTSPSKRGKKTLSSSPRSPIHRKLLLESANVYKAISPSQKAVLQTSSQSPFLSPQTFFDSEISENHGPSLVGHVNQTRTFPGATPAPSKKHLGIPVTPDLHSIQKWDDKTPQRAFSPPHVSVPTPSQPTCVPSSPSPTPLDCPPSPLSQALQFSTPLVCFLHLEKCWRAGASTLQHDLVLKQPWFGLDLSGLPLYPGVTESGHKILGIVEGDCDILRNYLEQTIGLPLPPLTQQLCFNISPATTCSSSMAYAELSNSIIQFNRSLDVQRRHENVIKSSLKHLNRAQSSIRHRKKLLSLDVEAYEFNHSLITEIGYTIATFRGNSYTLKTQHIIISDHISLVNGVRVANHKFDFKFGTSSTLSLQKAIGKLKVALKSVDYIVGHAISSDEKFLRKFGISFAGKTIYDTQVMVKPLLNPPTSSQLKLSKILDNCDLEYDGLHNAGNDSQFTMEAFLWMGMGGKCRRIEWEEGVIFTPLREFGDAGYEYPQTQDTDIRQHPQLESGEAMDVDMELGCAVEKLRI